VASGTAAPSITRILPPIPAEEVVSRAAAAAAAAAGSARARLLLLVRAPRVEVAV
jgi:hypothetical protein